MGDVDDESLREELESCKHFLTDTEKGIEDTESTTLPCHPLTSLCSTINWIIFSKN